MDTFLDMQTELISRANAAGSSFNTLDRIKSALNIAKTWAEDAFMWRELEDSETTSSEAGVQDYDYPQRFRTESIIRVILDNTKYNPKNFDDFLDYQMRTNPPPDQKRKIYADYLRKIFIWPTPTTDGNKNLIFWGLTNTDDMVADTDTTIFSKANRGGNEAIVKYALGILLAKGKDKKTAQTEQIEALNMLSVIFKKQLDRLQKNQRLDHARFLHYNFFVTGRSIFRPANFDPALGPYTDDD